MAANDVPLVFVSWEQHRRTREICAALNIELHELVSSARGLRRYAALVPRTLGVLWRSRGHAVIVQNPSLVLSLLAVLARPLFSLRVIMDGHNEAIEPFLNAHPLMARISRWLQRRCDYVIVTNRFLAETVTRNGGRALVLPDRVPEPPPQSNDPTPRGSVRACDVVVIATYVKDEPIADVLEAARLLGEDYRFHVTGNHRKLDAAVASSAPANVTFTGFLGERDYWELLRSADLIVDLSLMDNCLVCGAYEALAVGTPLVLSENRATVELFAPVARFTDNSPSSIASAIRAARSSNAELRARAPQLRAQLRADWQHSASELRRRFTAAPERQPA